MKKSVLLILVIFVLCMPLSLNAAYLDDRVSVTQYGVIPNDGIEDTQALIAALASGNALYFPRGTYLLAPINIPSNANITGNGAVLKFSPDTNGVFINISNAVDVVLEGLVVDGGDLVEYTSSMLEGSRSGIYINSSQNVKLKGITVKGFNKNGLWVTYVGYNTNHSKAVNVSDCLFENNYTNINFDTRAEYCQVSDTQSIKGRTGIKINSGNVYVSNSFFNDNIDGVHLLSGTNNAHGTFSGCSINHNADYGIITDGVSYGEVFTGCNIFENDIYLKNSSGVQISQGQISDSNIYLQGGQWNCIRDNYFSGSISVYHNFLGFTDYTEFVGNNY